MDLSEKELAERLKGFDPKAVEMVGGVEGITKIADTLMEFDKIMVEKKFNMLQAVVAAQTFLQLTMQTLKKATKEVASGQDRGKDGKVLPSVVSAPGQA